MLKKKEKLQTVIYTPVETRSKHWFLFPSLLALVILQYVYTRVTSSDAPSR